MRLEHRDGLLYTSITICHDGKEITIDNVVVDTGASHCICEAAVLEKLGIEYDLDDLIETLYGVNSAFSYYKRTIDSIKTDIFCVEKVEMFVGTIDEDINMLMGLDLLIKIGAVINLKESSITNSN